MPSLDNSNQSSKTKQEDFGYPPLGKHREKVFVVVKTAPRPSKKHREIVCTAGITQNGKWIRLYPISFRYMNYFLRYSKYQWIEVEIQKSEKDPRIDSYNPSLASMQLGKKIPTGRDRKWNERKEIVLPTAKSSLDEIKKEYKKHKISLGIFKPKKIIDFIIEADNSDWSNSHQQVLTQQRLFGKQPKYLEKVPYKFSYRFVCNNRECKGHTMQITDWEIYELYRKIKNNYKKPLNEVLGDIKNKWLNEMWGKNKDSYLIVGSVHMYPSFVVLGVFWPPK